MCHVTQKAKVCIKNQKDVYSLQDILTLLIGKTTERASSINKKRQAQQGDENTIKQEKNDWVRDHFMIDYLAKQQWFSLGNMTKHNQAQKDCAPNNARRNPKPRHTTSNYYCTYKVLGFITYLYLY